MKRLSTATAIGVAAVLALTGCGRSDEPSAASSKQPDADAKISGTVQVWAMGTEGELLPQLVKGFEDANPGVKVEVTPVPWESASQKITTAITTGNTPDVVQVGTTWMSGFVDQDAFAPTPDWIDQDRFFPGAWGTTVVDGTSYGVPWYVETRALFHRTDLAGSDGADELTSWDGLKSYAKAMQAGGAQYGLQLMTSGLDITNMWLPFFWQAGGDILDEDGTSFTLDSEAAQRSIDYYASFMAEGIAPKVATDDDKMQNFVDGKLGAFVSGPWDVANAMTVADDPAFAEKFTVTPLPADQVSASFIGGSDLSVFKDAKNPDAAWQLVQYLTQPATQVEWNKISSDLPAVQASWDDPQMTSDPIVVNFGEALKTAKSVPAIPNWAEISAKLDKILESAVAGSIDGAEAAKQMQAAASAIGTGIE